MLIGVGVEDAWRLLAHLVAQNEKSSVE